MRDTGSFYEMMKLLDMADTEKLYLLSYIYITRVDLKYN